MLSKTKGLSISLLILLSLLIISCGVKDSDIQTAITEKETTVPELTGITRSVNNGVVTLSGQFKDEAARTAAEDAIKSIKGVKSLVDSTTITPPPPPVVINPDDALRSSAGDAAKNFPGVTTSVQDGVITLTGNIKRKDLPRLMQALNSLQPKKIENKLTIK